MTELNLDDFRFYRNLTPCLCYNVDGGLPITDYLLNATACSPPRSLMNEFNRFINFTHIIHDKDLAMFSIFLDYTTINRSPIDMLIHRLQTLNDLEAYKLSENLKLLTDLANKVKSQFPIPTTESPSLLFDPYQIPSQSDNEYRDFKGSVSSLCMKYKDKPYLAFRSRRNSISNLMVLVELGISAELADLLGYEKDKFIQRILKRGFPQIFGDKQSLRVINGLVEGINRYNLGEKADITFEFSSEKYGIIAAKAQLEIVFFLKNNYIEFFTLQYFEVGEMYKKKIEAIKREEKLDSLTRERVDYKNGKTQEKIVIVEDLPFRNESIIMLTNHYPKYQISEEKNTDIYRCNYKKI